MLGSDAQYMYTTFSTVCTYGNLNGSPVNLGFGNLPPVSPTTGGGTNYTYILEQTDGKAFMEGANDYEKEYYKYHPWLIPAAIRNKRDAESMVMGLFGHDIDGDNGNAYKHAFWSAMNAVTWDSGIARFMGVIHESNDPNIPATEVNSMMDLTNNDMGIKIADLLRPKISDPKDLRFEIKVKILDALDAGKLKRVVNGVLVDTNDSGHFK